MNIDRIASRIAGPDKNQHGLKLPENEGKLRMPDKNQHGLRDDGAGLHDKNQHGLKVQDGDEKPSPSKKNEDRTGFKYWDMKSRDGKETALTLMDKAVEAGAIEHKYAEKWNEFKENWMDGKKLKRPTEDKERHALKSAINEIFRNVAGKIEFKQEAFKK